MCGCLLRSPYWGPGLPPQACALTGNQTSDSLVHRLALNPLSHTSQGNSFLLLRTLCKHTVYNLLKLAFLTPPNSLKLYL